MLWRCNVSPVEPTALPLQAPDFAIICNLKPGDLRPGDRFIEMRWSDDPESFGWRPWAKVLPDMPEALQLETMRDNFAEAKRRYATRYGRELAYEICVRVSVFQ